MTSYWEIKVLWSWVADMKIEKLHILEIYDVGEKGEETDKITPRFLSWPNGITLIMSSLGNAEFELSLDSEGSRQLDQWIYESESQSMRLER